MSARLYLFPSDRAHDESLVRVLQGLVDRGREITVPGDEPQFPTSPYLRRRLRNETEARIERLLREQVAAAWSRLHNQPYEDDEHEPV